MFVAVPKLVVGAANFTIASFVGLKAGIVTCGGGRVTVTFANEFFGIVTVRCVPFFVTARECTLSGPVVLSVDSNATADCALKPVNAVMSMSTTEFAVA